MTQSRENIVHPLYDWLMFQPAEKRIKILQGGTSSGKTYTVMEYLHDVIIQDRQPTLSTVYSATIPDLRRGAMRDFEEIIEARNSGPYWEVSKGYRTWTSRYSGSVIEFLPVVSMKQMKQGKRDRAFFNEVNHLPKPLVEAAVVRTTKGPAEVIFDYNPDELFWVHEDYIGRPDVAFCRTTYLDNPFRTPVIDQSMELAKVTNPAWYQVYGLGYTGTIEGRIYTNPLAPEWEEWQTHDFEAWVIDYGFDPDPTAIARFTTRGKNIYAEEKVYLTELETDAIDRHLEAAGAIRKRTLIIADSAEKRLNTELENKGWNIFRVVKGPGSVLQGISLVKNYTLSLNRASVNFRKEYLRYVKIQKPDGTFLSDPAPRQADHLLDCLRYYVMTMSSFSQARGFSRRA